MTNSTEINVFDQVEAALHQLPVNIEREYEIAAGARIDFRVTTKQGNVLIVEVKTAQSGYLAVSSWGQLVMYKKLMQEWKNVKDVTPVIITNLKIAPDLGEMLRNSGMVVVELGSAEKMAKSLKDQLEKIGVHLDHFSVGKEGN